LKEILKIVRKLSADYIFPISKPPVKNGILLVNESGKIMEDVIDPETLDYKINDVENHSGFICPGFINTHCHLELSYLKDQIPKHSGLNRFIREIEHIRKNANESMIDEAMIKAENDMIQNGIVAVGDISNNNASFKIKNNSQLYYHTFIEAFASDSKKAKFVFDKSLTLFNEISKNLKNKEASITPHAPYSLSKDLFCSIKDFSEKSGNIISIHHQESETENDFFLRKNEPNQNNNLHFGVINSDFAGCGLRPISAISSFLPINNKILFVHNTVANEADIDFALSYFPHTYWCFCPNANLYIEQKLPDFSLFFNRKCKITIGTDSLASNYELSVLKELQCISSNMPFMPLTELLKWATRNGAEFMEIQENYGSLEKGKKPGINLITNVNVERLQLTKNATIHVLS